MLATMKTRATVLSVLIVSTLVLSGCGTASAPTAEPSASATAESRFQAVDIVTIDDGITWARGLGDWATATELSNGINKIGALVPEQDIWFATSNQIGSDLISLNLAIQEDPDNAAMKVDDLNAIIDQIEAAIEKGNAP